MALKVLVVDDQPDIRSLIRMSLEFEDMEVLEAENGARGLALARQHRPDLILMDVMMPGDSGLVVGKAIAADPDLRQTPVIFLSAKGQSGDVRAGMDTGARAYMVKPFSPDGLVNLIHRTMAEVHAERGA